MIFATWPANEAEGLILAHSIKLPGGSFRKGRRLSADDVIALCDAGIAEVIAIQLEAGDCAEDEAATRIAKAAAGTGLSVAEPFTGRVNLIATQAGVLVIDRARLDEINLIDEAITIATLPPFAAVEPRQMLATIKIIPFAAPEAAVLAAEALAREAAPLIRLAPFRPRRAGLIQTELPSIKSSVLDKTEGVLAERMTGVGGVLAFCSRAPHKVPPLAQAIRDQLTRGLSPILIAGASAITDRRDVIPAAIEAVGGVVEHFGMPVDPGNLMLLGRVGDVPVIGLPGCARSPKINGFDWVLQRIAADIPVTRRDIMAMGAGGLLTEIASRPQPREGRPTPAPVQRAPRIGAILLAAGQSRRMGTENKLLLAFQGRPLAVHTLTALLHAGVERPVLTITGHEAEQVEAVLTAAAPPDGVRFLHNPDYAAGLSTSLATGLAAIPTEWDGAFVMLGDMPGVDARTLKRMIAAFNPLEGRSIVVPTHQGKRGNPVLWDRRFFSEMRTLSGDSGAKHLIGEYADLVAEVEMETDGVLVDLDTPEALAAYRSRG